mmetsp:Transcript_37696/g.121153  ORF Transcript_37696/g.121153 Transcript_37696/m.121153 type:complete len:258 (+) Transcript_37696:293-1066(+)
MARRRWVDSTRRLLMKSWNVSRFCEKLALHTYPRMRRPRLGSSASTGISSRATAAPYTRRITSSVEWLVRVCSSVAVSPAFLHDMATPALSMAYACTTCRILEYSSPAPLMAARRIGMLKNMSSTTIWVPWVPAHALGSAASPDLAGTITPSAYVARYAHGAPAVIEVMETCATCEMDASASPRKPKVSICSRSSYSRSLEVANRSHTRGKSPRAIPWPLSLICSSFIPPALDRTLIEVEPASSEFSNISLSALAGR